MKELIFKEEAFAIVGACMEVQTIKGIGFVEPVYQECLEIEFGLRGIRYSAQTQLSLSYKEVPLKSKYIPDFICHEKIIVEIKAVKCLADQHTAQVFNYLKATGFELGILVNFASYPKLEYKRIVRSK